MSDEFRLGPWLVQPSQNTISNHGKTTRLEPKMVEVLVCLTESLGETVSKEQLIRKVWGDTFVPPGPGRRAAKVVSAAS